MRREILAAKVIPAALRVVADLCGQSAATIGFVLPSWRMVNRRGDRHQATTFRCCSARPRRSRVACWRRGATRSQACIARPVRSRDVAATQDRRCTRIARPARSRRTLSDGAAGLRHDGERDRIGEPPWRVGPHDPGAGIATPTARRRKRFAGCWVVARRCIARNGCEDDEFATAVADRRNNVSRVPAGEISRNNSVCSRFPPPLLKTWGSFQQCCRSATCPFRAPGSPHTARRGSRRGSCVGGGALLPAHALASERSVSAVQSGAFRVGPQGAAVEAQDRSSTAHAKHRRAAVSPIAASAARRRASVRGGRGGDHADRLRR